MLTSVREVAKQMFEFSQENIVYTELMLLGNYLS